MKTDESAQSLEEVRELIDSVDREIVMLLKQRSRLVDLVAKIKKDTGEAAHQPTRFAVIVDQLQSIAKEEGLDTELVIEVWDAIHASSLRQQAKELEDKS